jgi:hypothetical protein
MAPYDFEHLGNSSNEEQQIQILNSLGMLFKEIFITHSKEINITDLPGGIYFIQIIDGLQHTQKFIKQ